MKPGNDPRFALDKRAMALAFDRASREYDAAAQLQAQVRMELLERLQFLKRTPARVLDVGSGTGVAAIALAQAFPQAQVIALDMAPGMLAVGAATAQRVLPAARLRRSLRSLLGAAVVRLPVSAQRLLVLPPVQLCADATRLPLANASVDLIFSNLMLQWCEDLDAGFAEFKRVLRPGGLLLFSSFGPDTLCELRQAWSAADGYNHVNRFVDMHDVGSALARQGFAEPVLDVDRIARSCGDVHELMQELKQIGAHNVTEGRARGLTGRTRWRAMQQSYEAQRIGGRLPVSYEVIYGCAWMPQSNPSQGTSTQANDQAEIAVDVADIGVRRRR